MKSLETYIDFNKLKPEEFEELCFQLILKSENLLSELLGEEVVLIMDVTLKHIIKLITIL
ncbi:MAG: hypothetical protein RSD40_01430 [Bacilli bacterium]